MNYTIRRLRDRLITLHWKGFLPSAAQFCASPEELLRTLVKDEESGGCFWQDIEYGDCSRANWKAAFHYQRMLYILGFYGPKLWQQDAAYAEKLKGALRYWLYYDFQSDNWWYNDIGMPQSISSIMLMLYPMLEKELLELGAERISRGSMAVREDMLDKSNKTWMGANVVWASFNTIKHGVLIEKEEVIKLAANRVLDTLRVGEAMGIQRDGSYFMHGPRLYSGGYGRDFLYDIAQLIYVLQDTPYQLPAAEQEHLLMHVLDGLRYMTRGDCLDWCCTGREYTRIGRLKVGKVLQAVELLAELSEIPRKEELQKYLAVMKKEDVFVGTKYFPDAAFLSHHREDMYVGVKFMSSQNFGVEHENSENLLGYNMSYGTHLCIMRDGEEYLDIAPIWDYAGIPGTTAVPEGDEALLGHDSRWRMNRLPNEHCGGIQEGAKGIAYELAEHDEIKGYIAAFAFEHGFVYLGAGINAPEGTELVTTVDQCHYRGHLTQRESSILHNGIRYTGLLDTELCHKVKKVTGSWKRNNAGALTETVQGEVLSINFPQMTDHYAWMLSSSRSELPKVEILQNDTMRQAIKLEDGSILEVRHDVSPTGVCRIWTAD